MVEKADKEGALEAAEAVTLSAHIKGRLLDFIEAKQPKKRILAPLPSTQPKEATPLTIRSKHKDKELIQLLQAEDEDMRENFCGGTAEAEGWL